MATESYNSFVYNMSDKTQNQEEKKTNSITIGVFFDGTCNNRYNVAARKSNSEAFKKYDGNDSSYDNDPSNVERMYDYYIDKDPQTKFYIEGIGTSSAEEKDGVKYGSDDLMDGTGFGHFENGIRAKVLKACEKAAKKASPKIKDLTSIIFDVFGFSRGSAAARNFVNEVTQNSGIQFLNELRFIDDQLYVDTTKKENKAIPKYGFLGYYLLKNNFTVNQINRLYIQIRFVGIYDTVSSYSLIPINFKDDVAELKLNTVNYWAKKLVHLTAADEHRDKFGLTHIYPSGEDEPKKRIEISLPGVHSDVGGCYVDRAKESVQIQDYDGFSQNIKNKLETEKQQLINQGWFKEHELKINKWNELIGTRYYLSNKYSYIPLHIMHRFAMEFNRDLFNDKLPKYYYILEPYDPIMAMPMGDYIQARFENNWMPYWEEEDNSFKLFSPANKSASNFPSYDSYPDPLTKRKSELLAEINVNINLNGLAGVCPSEDQILCYAKHVIEKHAFNNQPTMIYKTAQDILDTCWGGDFMKPKELSDFSADVIRQKLPALKEEIIKQNYLHILRNRFLHWSSHYGEISRANVPAPGRQRANY